MKCPAPQAAPYVHRCDLCGDTEMEKLYAGLTYLCCARCLLAREKRYTQALASVVLVETEAPAPVTAQGELFGGDL